MRNFVSAMLLIVGMSVFILGGCYEKPAETPKASAPAETTPTPAPAAMAPASVPAASAPTSAPADSAAK